MSDKFRLTLDAARDGEYLNLSGRKIEIVGASSPTATVNLQAIYANGFTRSAYEFQEEFKARSAQQFVDLKVSHAAQAGEWVEIQVTRDDDEWVYERRTDLTISSITTPVEIDSTTPVKVDDDATQAALATLQTAVEAITSMLQNGDDQREGMTTLNGFTYAGVSGSNSTVVSAAANVNGILIASANMSTTGVSGNSASITVGGNAIMRLNGSTGYTAAIRETNIHIPAGVALVLNSSATSSNVDIWYKVL